MEYDVFIAYASEDKDDFVEPLAIRLRNRGLKVWYDRFTLKLGDSLSDSINRGLANSLYGIVVISKYFLSKKWPQRELGALLASEDMNQKKILPVWHNITLQEVTHHYPLLSDIIAAQSVEGIDVVVDRILEVVDPNLIKQKASAISRISHLSSLIEFFLEANLRSTREMPDFQEVAIQAHKSIKVLTTALNEIARTGDANQVVLSLVKSEKLITNALSMYCVKCRSKQNRVVNAQRMGGGLYGKCPVCGTGMMKIR